MIIWVKLLKKTLKLPFFLLFVVFLQHFLSLKLTKIAQKHVLTNLIKKSNYKFLFKLNLNNLYISNDFKKNCTLF